ncbi:MAG: hypothetical protein ACFFE4_03955 [Candidatus Thorarchaeota archaeon]
MGWTPPSKGTVVITFITMAFSIFILLDGMGIWSSLLAAVPFQIAGYDGWLLVALLLIFLTWFLFFLGVKLKGM